MVEYISRSPGKVILLGEHAVVYNKLGIATTVDIYSNVEIKSREDNLVYINSINLKLKEYATKKSIENIINNIDSLRAEAERTEKLEETRKYIDEIKDLAKHNKLLPSFVVIGKIMKEYGFVPCSIQINSQVPKNLGSSASVFNGIAKGLSKFLGLDLPKEQIGFFANEGDKVVHGTPSGIDAYTIAHGGWVSYRKSEGIKPLNINFEFPLIIVDSGEPARTGETVGYIRKQREQHPSFVDSVLDRLDEISYNGLDAIKSQDLEKIGQMMIEYYRELKKLDISTPKLDEIVSIALKNNALGAKPTAGWGGGCCIVLARDHKQAEQLINIYKSKGFFAFQTRLGVEGVKLQ